MKKLAVALLGFFLTIGGAYGKTYHHRHGHLPSLHQSPVVHRSSLPHSGVTSIPHPGFPWCGWFLRTQVDKDPGPAYNRARQWLHFGHSVSEPFPGVIAVWPHHVAMIMGKEGNTWIVKEGNWANKVHVGPHSLAGIIGLRI